jgi:hypothetical protein
MLGNVDGAFCLRAFCNKPRGVEDGVMEAESDVLRSEGILGVFEGLEESSEGLPNGDSSSSSSVDSGDRGLVAKSFESSGASGGWSGEEAIVAYPDFYLRGMSGLAIVCIEIWNAVKAMPEAADSQIMVSWQNITSND